MQGTWIQSLVWEDSICRGTTNQCTTNPEPELQRLQAATTEPARHNQ